MSPESRRYYFACHMLYTMMQMYHEFYEHKLFNMSRVNDWYKTWSSDHNDCMGWTIEEISFIQRQEKLDNSHAIALEDLAEDQHSLLYEQAYTQLLDMALAHNRKRPIIEAEIYVYYSYCQLLALILRKFDSIINQPSFINTEYLNHYQETDLFEKFSYLLKNEIAYVEQSFQLADTEIKLKINQLGFEWEGAISSAVQLSQSIC
jgi:hypothetical protein